MKTKSSLLVAAVLVATSLFSVANAAVGTVGQLCGNKYIGLTQAGVEQTADICSDQNSTGSGSPIAAAGWINSAEYKNGSTTNTGPVILTITQPNTWSLSNPLNYSMLGISVKQGDGFAFYELSTALALLGQWFTGNSSPQTGFDVSHINAWYQGNPGGTNPEPVPIPGGIVLLLSGLAALCGLSRIRKSATAAA